MKWLLLWLLFFEDVGGGETTVHWPPRLPNCETLLMKLVFLGLVAGAIAAAIYMYKREPDYVPQKKKRVMTILRAAALLILVFVLTGAFLDVSRAESSQGALLLMFDSSRSMGLADKRTTREDLDAAARIMGMGGGALSADDRDRVNSASRADLVKRAVSGDGLGFFDSLGDKYRVEAFSFGKSSQVTPLELSPDDAEGGPLAKLGQPEDTATRLGGPIREGARKFKGQYIAGIVVFTDGAWNQGEDPMIVAEDLGVAIYPVGVGLPATKDIEIPFLFAESVVFKDDRFPIHVRIKQRGYERESARLLIKRDDVVIKEELIQFDDRQERTHTIEIRPTEEGVFTYSAEIEPRDDEMSAENNSKSKHGVRVIDRRIQVLIIEDSPRWEYRFLKSVLEGDRRRIEPTIILRQADEDLFRARSRLFRRDFPASADELRRYNLIVLGDVDSAFFTADELSNLEKYVRVGGGSLVVMAGRSHMPDSYADTPLADLLPIQFSEMGDFKREDETLHPITNGYRPALTDDGKIAAALRLSPDPAENEMLWDSAEELYWFYPAERLKPAAVALLVHPHESNQYGPMPILAHQRYGKGQTMYFGTDETWRWRHKPGSEYHRRMWGQVVTFLSMAHLLGETNRIQIETDKGDYAVGDPVKVVARILDENYAPLEAEAVVAVVERGGLEREDVNLAAQKEAPGLFQGEYRPTAEGRYRVVIEGEEDEAEHYFAVTVPQIEFDDPGMREDLLKQVATVSGGDFVRLDQLDELADKLKGKKHNLAPRREERSLWNAPGVIIFFTLLLGVEWLLRKRSDLL